MGGSIRRQGRGDAGREIRRGSRLGFGSQRVADHLPAADFGPEGVVTEQSLQHEARGLVGQGAVVPGTQLFAEVIGASGGVRGHRRAHGFNSGFKRASIASRARKMRERTVPIGHCMRSAISS